MQQEIIKSPICSNISLHTNISSLEDEKKERRENGVRNCDNGVHKRVDNGHHYQEIDNGHTRVRMWSASRVRTEYPQRVRAENLIG